MIRALLLVDGASDAGLTAPLTRFTSLHGFEIDIVAPDLARLPRPPGREVRLRVEAALGLDAEIDVVLVHRDAEGQPPDMRRAEITAGVESASPGMPSVPVVPVRMTEAWLLTDEAAIRRIAGRPSGSQDLGICPAHQLEAIADPKRMLQNALERASGLSGRHLGRFRRRFASHRRQLFEELDPMGPVTGLTAWQTTCEHLIAALQAIPT